MSERVDWHRLPLALRVAVERETGAVTAAVVVVEGLNCSLALAVHTERYGRLFLKGVREDDTDGVAALRCEVALNRTVAGVGPVIRHSVRAAGWFCLAFVHIDGRHAELGPGTGDLARVAAVLGRMALLRPPPGVPVPRLVERFAAHLLDGEAERLSGGTLLHTDTNPHNIMVGHAGGESYVIDWAMPAVGPAWVDPAYTAVRLLECDQPAEVALAWLAGFPSWRAADRAAVETFVDVTCRHWTATVGERGAEPSNARFRVLLGRV
ncbi:phosphotransferase [Streptomyces sp. NPDC001985]|uniref:phosphotransferase n=1 Tax=Streptomyces sp. NPDC001985 TaxID=3154406 RepID=UPI003320C5D4